MVVEKNCNVCASINDEGGHVRVRITHTLKAIIIWIQVDKEVQSFSSTGVVVLFLHRGPWREAKRTIKIVQRFWNSYFPHDFLKQFVFNVNPIDSALCNVLVFHALFKISRVVW